MELNGQQLIPASQQRTWDALNDPDILKACIPGCETLERTAEGGFTATLALRIGPVSARFKGQLTLSDVQPPNSYTMHFDGQGGVAGFGKGSAQVQLQAQEGGTQLSYQAKAQVGGKLAQVGSRLVDAAAGKITDEFFKAFSARVAADAQAAGEVPPAAEAAGADGASAAGAGAGSGGAAASQTPASSAAQSAGIPSWVWWVLGAAAAALAFTVLRG